MTGYRKRKPLNIKDIEQFRQFILNHPDKTQQQLAELWGSGLTQQNVSNALKKLKITRKKLMDIRNETKKKERNLLLSSKGKNQRT